MTLPLVLVDDDGIRPAGSPGACFYCHADVGTPHLCDCVILQRRVKVRYVFEIEIDVPHCWVAEDVEFNRNDSSWCADNAVDDVSDFLAAKGDGCLCNDFTCEVLVIPEAEPFRRNRAGEVVP